MRAVQKSSQTKQAIEYSRPYLYPKQEAAIFNGARITAIEASTKSGKTVGGIIWLTEHALAGKQGYNYWWVAPSNRQASYAFERLKNALPPELYDANETHRTLELFNGAVIWFISGEKPNNLYGEDVWAAVIDEASRVREAAFIAVRTTLTATRGPMLIIGNVRGKRNWAYRLARRIEAGDLPDAHYAKIVAQDAVEGGVIAPEEIELARATLPEGAFKELYDVEAADDGSNPFGHDAIRDIQMELPARGPVEAFGIDLAKSQDWTVIIGLNKLAQVCYFERFQRDWTTTKSRIVEVIGTTPTMIDQTGVGDAPVEDIQLRSRAEVEGFWFTQRSKQELLSFLAVEVQNRAIGIPAMEDGYHGREIAMEMEGFEFAYTATGVVYRAPDGEHDDCVMALALALKRLKTPTFEPLIGRA